MSSIRYSRRPAGETVPADRLDALILLKFGVWAAAPRFPQGPHALCSNPTVAAPRRRAWLRACAHRVDFVARLPAASFRETASGIAAFAPGKMSLRWGR